MRPNSRQLAMRDPALAAFTGAIGGASFGEEPSDFEAGFAEFGAEFGNGEMHDDLGAEFGDDLGAEFGDDFSNVFGADPFGDGFGADLPPTPAAAVQVWKAAKAKRGRSVKRGLMLYPNQGSSLKLEQFSFPIAPAANPVFGAASAVTMTNQPDATIRPERLSFNVPAAGLFSIAEVKVGNISALIGASAAQDAYFFNPLSVGMRLSLPTLSPANRLTILGTWSALVPVGYVNATAFPLSAIATGPAKMAG